MRYHEVVARRPRRELPNGFFHATARGTNRTAIFLDDRDCEAFARLLVLVQKRWHWKVAAFCLMPNHYHVVLESTVEQLSKGMHALNGRHARRFNERHGRSGHLFQERFDARVIESESYFHASCQYVLENPVRAKLTRTPTDWPWSSAARSLS